VKIFGTGSVMLMVNKIGSSIITGKSLTTKGTKYTKGKEKD
jgi:hypothetical protein